jgi:hypothetical protein
MSMVATQGMLAVRRRFSRAMLRAIRHMLRGNTGMGAELSFYMALRRRGLSCYKTCVQSLRRLHV